MELLKILENQASDIQISDFKLWIQTLNFKSHIQPEQEDFHLKSSPYLELDQVSGRLNAEISLLIPFDSLHLKVSWEEHLLNFCAILN